MPAAARSSAASWCSSSFPPFLAHCCVPTINAPDLQKIYQTMNSRLVMETKKTEIGAFFSAAAAALVLIAGLLSLAWFNRIL